VAETGDGPAVKGIVLEIALAAIRRVLDEGGEAKASLERRLDTDARRLLAEGVISGLWYPMPLFARLLAISTERDTGPAGRDELIESGARAADRLASSQVYERFVASAGAARSREEAGRVLVGMAPLIFNFSRWIYRSDPGGNRFHVDVEDAGPIPDVLRHIGEGFIGRLASLVNGVPVRMTSQRPAPDRMEFLGIRGG
jgi:hypothetical protein